MSARRAALRVACGAGDRAKHVLAPGARLVVGRSAECDVSLPSDPELSSIHCAIEWDGIRGLVRDEGSRRGTEVGGVALDGAAEIGHRAWIHAGSTDLVFEIEMRRPAVPDARRSFRDALEPPLAAGRLWGIVDASRGDRIDALLHSSVDAGRSLYEGLQGDVLAEVAPYLLRFEPGSRLVDALCGDPTLACAVLYLESDGDERALRRHFRRFLVVDAEGIGPRTYFRFYDPSVLATFWEMATPRQRGELAHGVDAFWVPSGEHDLARLVGPERAPLDR